jgi:hypothetical protein
MFSLRLAHFQSGIEELLSRRKFAVHQWHVSRYNEDMSSKWSVYGVPLACFCAYFASILIKGKGIRQSYHTAL